MDKQYVLVFNPKTTIYSIHIRGCSVAWRSRYQCGQADTIEEAKLIAKNDESEKSGKDAQWFQTKVCPCCGKPESTGART